MKFFAVEGNTQRLDGGSMFGNAPKALWERWVTPDELNRIPLACRALLLQLDDGRNVLFETGVGAFFDPKLKDRYGVVEEEHMLLKNLQALDLSHEDIDIVILSHMHFDHAGGILSAFADGEPRLLFPKATFYTSQENWKRAEAPHPRDRASFIPLINGLLKSSGRLEFIETASHPSLDFGISFRFVHGHTPGLMLSEISLESGPLVFVSDLVPAMPWVHIPITMGYDRYPELVVNEKTNFLNEMLDRNGKIFFTHDPTVSCVTIRKDEKGKFFGEPTSLESLQEEIKR
ncbi:MAG: glyoxylase-like metal-dependent hydrolase (beta-lactamase superfamily II) [Chlamydiales bacterium]|jgi:glyoxylase-like metal-dependent hydrolase (beta-lactamase superfamily II)